MRATTHFFTARLCIAPGVVRGLPPLQPQFRLKVPRLPAGLLQTILTDARASTPSSAGWLPGRKSGCGRAGLPDSG